MACFIVSTAEAAVVHVIEKKQLKKEESAQEVESVSSHSIPLSTKLNWLKYMLLGGSFILMFEHIWHGEIVPWFPFLTAASSMDSAIVMLKEMATVGVLMAVAITVVWAVVCSIAEKISKKDDSVTETA